MSQGNAHHSVASTAPPSSGPQQGQKVGPFILCEEVGHGGFGAVYRAEHTEHPGDFAIKLIHWHHANQQQLIQRFQREAFTLSQLNHPNIVRLVDFGQIEQVGLYMGMEYLDGRNLADVLVEEFPLPSARLQNIIWQLCDALQHAHSKGIVHRDLKPSNIIVCQRPEGEVVKLIDFGIAAVSEHTQMTQTGTFLGSPAYMSPEQIKGERLDIGAASDIYSLAVLCTQLMTQKRPFEANNLTGYLTHHLFTQPPPLAALRPECQWHPAVEACIAKCLAKEPEARYQSTHEMGKELIEGLRAMGEIRLLPLPREELLTSGAMYPPDPIPGIHQLLHTQQTPINAISLLSKPDNGEHTPSLPFSTAQATSRASFDALDAHQTTFTPSPDPPTWLWPLVGFIALLMVGMGMYFLVDPSPPAKKPPQRAASEPTMGQLLLNSQPSHAKVFQGPKLICQTPCPLRGRVGTRQTLVLTTPGYQRQQITVTYSAHRVEKLLQLQKLPPPRNATPDAMPLPPPTKAVAPPPTPASRKRPRPRVRKRRYRRRRRRRYRRRRRKRRRRRTKRRPTNTRPFDVDPLKDLKNP